MTWVLVSHGGRHGCIPHWDVNVITCPTVRLTWDLFVAIIGNKLKQNEAQSARVDSKHKGVNQPSKYVTRVQQDVPLVEFMYLVLTRMPGES